MSELSNRVATDMMVRIIKDGQENQPLLNEAELCTMYGVSRVVVREAKKRLQALGMVQSRKKTGSHITSRINWNFFNQNLFDVYLEHSGRANEHMEDYFTMRLLIEPHLAAQVATSHTPEFARTISQITKDMADALNEGDDQKWLHSDLKYHISLYQESGNVLVLPLANLMRPLFLRGFASAHAAWPASQIRHRQLTEAILDNDSDQAFHYTRLIIRGGHEDYLTYGEPTIDPSGVLGRSDDDDE